MVKLSGVTAKDTMSAMVKLTEMFQQSSLDVISYSMVSHSMTISWEKVCRAMLSFFAVQLNAGFHDISFEEKGGIASRDQCESREAG